MASLHAILIEEIRQKQAAEHSARKNRKGNRMTEAAVAFDPVNRPSHYMGQGGIEVIDVIERYGIAESFHLGAALKYLLRHENKGGKQDLEKALWFVRRYRYYWSEANGLTPTLYEGAEEWATAEQIVEAFGLAGTPAGEAVECILALATCEGDEEELFGEIENAIEQAISEAA
jgi:hypothetical protein